METNEYKKPNDKKFSNSGLRVLELLKALPNEPMDVEGIFSKVGEKRDILCKKEVLWKYINTLKLLGINVIKDKEKYYISNVIDPTDYNERDLSILKFIKNYTRQLQLKSLQNGTESVLQKIEKTFSKSTRDLINSKNISEYKLDVSPFVDDKNVQKFEKYCKDGLKLNIKYKISGEEKTCYKISPLKIVYKNQKAILIAYDCQNFEYKEFLLKYIVEDEQTPQKASGNYSSTVIFKLTGRLAKSYILRDCEKMIEFGNDYIVVANSQEDKSMLLKRLLRYYDKCEITYPTEIRNQMINTINNIEKIYG